MADVELIPDLTIEDLGRGERLALSSIRMIAAGRTACSLLKRAVERDLGSQCGPAFEGLIALTSTLPCESARKLTLGRPCIRGITWDEAGVLALIEAAQRTDQAMIQRWFQNLGVDAPSVTLQRALAWISTSFAVGDCRFETKTADYTRAKLSSVDGASMSTKRSRHGQTWN